MAGVQYSVKARADLRAIAVHTRRRWGAAQTVRYLDEIKSCCQRLAEQPLVGRPCDELAPGLLAMSQGRHVIYYRVQGKSIRVVTILHQRMLPERHLRDV